MVPINNPIRIEHGHDNKNEFGEQGTGGLGGPKEESGGVYRGKNGSGRGFWVSKVVKMVNLDDFG
jgi:hypothetical protein